MNYAKPRVRVEGPGRKNHVRPEVGILGRSWRIGGWRVRGPERYTKGAVVRRAVSIVGIVGALLALASPVSALTVQPLHAEFKETFGRAATKPCEHFICGTGTVQGFGRATSVFDITSFEPIEGTNCADLEGVRVITLVGDGSTLTLEEDGVVCFPGNSFFTHGSQVSFGNPASFEGTFEVSDGSGVFRRASGSGTSRFTNAGDSGHATLDGTISLR